MKTVVVNRGWMIAAVVGCACGTGEAPTDADASGAAATDADPSGGAQVCADANDRGACLAIVGIDGLGCHWLDLYRSEPIEGACFLEPIAGGGVCVENPAGDTDCGAMDACGTGGTVYWRIADDGSTEVLRSGSTCGNAEPEGAWMSCPPSDGGGASSGGVDGDTASTGGAVDPHLCSCACGGLAP